jgi:hypothetical protein
MMIDETYGNEINTKGDRGVYNWKNDHPGEWNIG